MNVRNLYFNPFFNPAIDRCRCSGDPHCLTFDQTLLHYYGACSYTLVRDECVNGSVNGNSFTFLE